MGRFKTLEERQQKIMAKKLAQKQQRKTLHDLRNPKTATQQAEAASEKTLILSTLEAPDGQDAV